MRKSNGFTLIEVLITVAIIAILSAIAIPSYTEYVQRARLTEATSTLAGMIVKMDKFYQDNRTYANSCSNPALPGIAPLPLSAHFVYTCPDRLPATFLIRATGSGSMTGFTYTINQANQRTTEALPSGWTGTGNTCWVIRKDGSC